jgi:hypothetical protein
VLVADDVVQAAVDRMLDEHGPASGDFG